jgi:hypothetical protein
MNWYKRAQRRLSGEWWFIDGQAHFADMDIGENSHESMAKEWAEHEIEDSFFAILNRMADQLHEIGLNEKGVVEIDGRIPWMETRPHLILKNIENGDTKNHGLAQKVYDELVKINGAETVDVGLHMHGSYPVLWGLKKGWVRCKGNWLEMWAINSKTLDCAVRGIWDAYQDTVEDNTLFNIEQASNRKHFEDVPLNILEEKNPSALLQFRGI